MTRFLLLQTITTPNRSILFSPLSTSGQGDTLSNCNLFRLMEHAMWSPLTSMVTHSSPFPITTLEVNTTPTLSFTSGMATSLSCSSLVLLVGPAAGIPFVSSGQTFLGVANYHGDSQKHNTHSVVYQASGSRFVNYQEIPTHGATDMASFGYKGRTHLAVANYYNGQKHNVNSALYKWV